jgi:outer membrane receptor protein involved in Fe transport
MRHTTSLSLARFRLLPLVLAVAAGSVSAQEKLILEEIVVTAQKREQQIQDVPISMTVDTAELLEKKGITTLEGLSNQTPSLFIQDGGRVSSVAIRGLGSPGLDTVESSVGIYVDEIYFGRSRLSRNPLFDMDRIEVLRGPQGTLYGRNTIAGAISMYTARPTDEFQGRVLAETGNIDSYKYEGYLSGPLADNVSGRVAAMASHRGAYLENSEGPDGGGQDTEAFRASLAWDPGESFSVFAKYDHMNHRNNGIYDQLIADPFGVWANYPGIDLKADDKQQVGGVGIQNIADSVGGYYVSDVMALHMNWDMDSGYSLKSITGLNKYDARSKDYITASPVDSLTINGLTEQTKYWSQELRLESPTDKPFRFIAGLFGDSYKMGTLPRDGQYAALNLGGAVLPNFVNSLATTPNLAFLNLPAFGGPGTQAKVAQGFANGTQESFRLITPAGSPDGQNSNLDQNIQTWSAYFEGTYEFNEQWQLTLGARYTDETNKIKMAKGTYYVNGDELPWGAFPTGAQIAATAIAADPTLSSVGAGLLGVIYGGTANAPIGGGLQVNDLPLVIAAPGGTPIAKDEISKDQVIPSAKLQYFMDDSTMFYLTVASGFKAGGFNSSNINAYSRATDSFDSEDALAIEIGGKFTLLDGAAQLNVAIFRTEFDELQVSTITAQGAATVINAAGATTQGLELDGSWRASETVTLGASYAYLDAKYTDSIPLTCGGYQKKIREQGGEVFSASNPCTFLLDDQPSGDESMQRAPENTMTIWGEYYAPVSGDWDLQLYGALNYRDKSSTSLENYFYADDLTLLSGRIALVNESSGWGIALFGNNLLDDDGIVLSQDNSGGAVKGIITTPRTYGLQLSKSL